MYIKRFSKFNPAVAIVRGTKHVHTFNVKWLRPKPKTCFLDFSHAKHIFLLINQTYLDLQKHNLLQSISVLDTK